LISLLVALQATSIRSIKSLVPLLDRVLVQRIKAEAKTAGGIFLPESSVKELNEAKVLAVGPGALSKDGARVPMGVSQGDRVLIPQVSLFEIMLVGVALPRNLIDHLAQSDESCYIE
jgi:chaperonin GroES